MFATQYNHLLASNQPHDVIFHDIVYKKIKFTKKGVAVAPGKNQRCAYRYKNKTEIKNKRKIYACTPRNMLRLEVSIL